MSRPFDKVLVANRGEIAIRVLRTCRRLGFGTVAIYSDADRESMHLEQADEAFNVGPPAPAESYLNAPKIIEVAKRAGAGAIHPGYGFLAENAAFARAVEEAGLVFIGPQPEVIEAMGEKVAARALMTKAGVPVIPGSEGTVPDADAAKAFAKSAGYPVLLKAAGGGGGKGMRIVHEESQIDEAFSAATSEALKNFSNPDLFIERYIYPARHIEIQVLGDTHGNFVHLGERECSVQRRFQKLVEETPSPFVDAEMRRRMGETAVTAAREMNYRNAATFEFVVDENRNFYFLEVNTRLQVEHPVTELVTGFDLVEQQLRIALGDEISPEVIDYSENPQPRGHAIECRINAESPAFNFAPSLGRIHFVRVPDGPGVRVDRGIRAGSEVSVWYDPLIAKLIVWGRNRPEAISRLKVALEEFQIHGIDTSLDFHRWLIPSEEFAGNAVHTKYVEEKFHPECLESKVSDEMMAIAAALIHHYEGSGVATVAQSSRGGGGNGGASPWTLTARAGQGRRW